MLYTRVLGASVAALMIASLPTLSQAETLKQALTDAYNHNPDFASSLYAAQATSESVPLAASATRPNLGLGASISDSFGYSQGVSANQFGPASLGLNYSQTLFDNGKTDANVKAARASTEAAIQSFRLEEQTVLLNAVTAYMDVVQNQQLVSLSSDNVKFYETQVKSTQDRLNLGEGTKIDVSQSQASLASSQAQYETAKANLQTSIANYERWVGHKPRNLTSAYRLNGLVPRTLDEALASADARHPQILAAKAAIASAQYSADAAKAAYGPTLSASGSLAQTFQLQDTGAANNRTALAGQLGLSLSLPIYEGGRLGASARQANLQAIKADLDAQTARASVHQTATTAWANLQNANAQIQSAQAAVNAGQLALEGVIQERDVGQATTLDVLNSQTTVTAAKEQLISANASKVIATFTLIAAEGRLSAQDLALNVKTKSPRPYADQAATQWSENY